MLSNIKGPNLAARNTMLKEQVNDVTYYDAARKDRVVRQIVARSKSPPMAKDSKYGTHVPFGRKRSPYGSPSRPAERHSANS